MLIHGCAMMMPDVPPTSTATDAERVLTQSLLEKALEVGCCARAPNALPRVFLASPWPGGCVTACACPQLYHEMKVLRLQPSTDTLNSLIVACGKAGQLDRAFAIFEYMLDDGDAFTLPTLTTINFLIREARRADDHERALGMLDRLDEINETAIFRRFVIQTIRTLQFW